MKKKKAGSQFSFPLIDLSGRQARREARWESVLFSPDRLDEWDGRNCFELGVSSLFP